MHLAAKVASSFRHLALACLAGLLFPSLPVQAQTGAPSALELGTPAMQLFPPADYGKNPQNWGIARDIRGVLYAANLDGVLEYDTKTWRLMPTRTNGWILSIAASADGAVYAGSYGDFGVLQGDENGQLQFVSLVDKVPEEHREFREVWRTHCIGAATWFRTGSRLFRWQNSRIDVWEAPTRFRLSATVGDTLYVDVADLGIMKMHGDSLRLIGARSPVRPPTMAAMLRYDDAGILVCGSRGLFLYDGTQFRRFDTQINRFVEKNGFSAAAGLPGRRFVFGTYGAGAAIANEDGDVIDVLDKTSGLLDQDIKNLFADLDGSLWLATNAGFARVHLHSPFSYFQESRGLRGNVVSIARHNGTLYAATSQGTFVLQPRSGAGPAASQIVRRAGFGHLEDVRGQSFWLLSTQHGLLAASNTGVYQIAGETVRWLDADRRGSFVLQKSRIEPDVVYVGLKHGLERMVAKSGRWQSDGTLEGITEEVRSIVEAEDGNLWLGTLFQGVLHVKVGEKSANTWSAEIKRYGPADGLPDGPVNVSKAGDRIVFATRKGHKRFHASKRRFVPDARISEMLADSSTSAALLHPAGDGSLYVWPSRSSGTEHLWRIRAGTDGEFAIDSTTFRPLSDFGLFHTAFADSDGVQWIGCNAGLVRYDPRIPPLQTSPPKPLIRRLATIRTDSVVYGGAGPDASRAAVLSPELNAVRFEYVLPSFDAPAAARYQHWLEGFDEGWSSWTPEPRKDYTNVPPGDYVFKVRARNIYDAVSDEASYSFSVLAPWYRSPWMYGLYALLIGAGVVGLVQLRVRSLENHSRMLERTIAERTAEVVAQRNKLQAQSEKLKELDTLKSRFFANISHEFRTPLTLILASLKSVEKDADPKLRPGFDVMQRNATRLLQLINQLLDLSKLEAGGIALRASRQDILQFVKRHTAAFSSMAQLRDISYTFNGESVPEAGAGAPIHAWFDADKLEKVFTNLLSNAFKFAPDRGRVAVEVSVGDEHDSEPDSGPQVLISVCNTGPGIPEDKLAHVFDRFYQVEDSTTRRYEGTGIGLALVKELVDLHKGSVRVTSVENGSTCFVVGLPLGTSHLRAEEMVEKQQDAHSEDIAESRGAPAMPSPTGWTDTAEEPDGGEQTLVLVVEDHNDLRQFICQQLSETYRVIDAPNGAEGWRQAEEHIPDLVISDVMMPEMDGYDLCTKLKSNRKTDHIPVILLTAKAAGADKRAGLKTGADDYLVKPFDAEELKLRVRNIVAAREKLREKFSSEMLLKPADVVVPSEQKAFLEQLMSTIEEHIDDEEFSVEQLGREIGMSRSQVHRKLQALTNQSASAFIRSFRLQRAAELLRKDAGNVAEIAYQVGFSSQAYFTRCFKEQFGAAPLEFKKREAEKREKS